MEKSFSFVVPVYNEEKNIKGTVDEILEVAPRYCDKYEILIFNDNSTDKTGEIIETFSKTSDRVRVFHNGEKMGVGYILKRGIQESKCQYFAYIPGDKQCIIEETMKCFEILFQSQKEIAIDCPGNTEVRTIGRRILSWLYLRIVQYFLGLNFRYTNGHNIYKLDAVKGVDVRANGFSMQTELLFKLIRKGCSFIEVKTKIRNRADGKSKSVNVKTLIDVGISLTRLILENKVFRKY